MTPLQYAAIRLALLAVAFVGVLFAYRAARRAATRWKSAQTMDEAAKRNEQSEKQTKKGFYTMRTADDIRREVETALGTFADEFDIDGIVDDLKGVLEFDARGGYASIDTLENDALNDIYARHDMQA